MGVGVGLRGGWVGSRERVRGSFSYGKLQPTVCVCVWNGCKRLQSPVIIIIMYIYHALINALSAHMIHINLNMIFYTHVEHSPTKTIYIK